MGEVTEQRDDIGVRQERVCPCSSEPLVGVVETVRVVPGRGLTHVERDMGIGDNGDAHDAACLSQPLAASTHGVMASRAVSTPAASTAINRVMTRSTPSCR